MSILFHSLTFSLNNTFRNATSTLCDKHEDIAHTNSSVLSLLLVSACKLISDERINKPGLYSPAAPIIYEHALNELNKGGYYFQLEFRKEN